jgi:hypothetical protein
VPVATSSPFGRLIVAVQVLVIPIMNVQRKRAEPIGFDVIFLLKRRAKMISWSPGLSPRAPTSTRV